MLDKTLAKVKNCILKKQGGAKINWTKAAKDIGLPKTTLWQIFEEERSPTWKNLSKILEYTECYIKCGKEEGHDHDCLKSLHEFQDKKDKAGK